MNLLNKLTYKNLKLNKKRTIVTIIGIILSVALITAVATLLVSFRLSLIKYKKIDSNYHYGFKNVPSNDIEKLKNNRNFESYYITSNLGYAKVNSKNENKPYAYIIGLDKKAINSINLSLIKGRLPENEKEIVISRHLKNNGGIDYDIDEIITLEVGKRVTEDNYELDQSNPFNTEYKEKIIDTEKHEYRVVGIMERPGIGVEPTSAPGYTFYTYIDKYDNNNLYDMYVLYNKKGLKNDYKITADILGIDYKILESTKGGSEFKGQEILDKYEEEMKKAKYGFTCNNYLLILEKNDFSAGDMFSTLFGMGVIVIIIIIVVSIFCIKNSFDISITEKIKQYGMLSSIGATSKQIKKNVHYEGFLLGLVGIPLGIMCGILASYLLIIISNYFLKDAIAGTFKLVFQTSIVAIIFSILLSIVTIYLSCRKSAKKASKIAPITAIRGNNDIKINRRKVKSPKYIKKIFGIGGDVSYKNLKRNKSKYRTTVISIIVCVAAYIGLSSFMGLAFKTIKLEVKEIETNINISINENNPDELVREITSLDNIDRYVISKHSLVFVDNKKTTDKFSEYYYFEENDNMELNIITLGDIEYKKYLKQLNLKYEDVKNKGILINNIIAYQFINEEIKREEMDVFKYKDKDIIEGLNLKDEKVKIEIAKVTNKNPFGYNNRAEALLIVSDELMNDLYVRDAVDILISTSDADKVQEEAEKILNTMSYNINNRDKNYRTIKSLYTLIAIFLYGFIIVIALIGITNIFNTITTSMELRSREFATLKSIGMTNNEFSKMIFLESLFYGVKSLFIGLPIGIIISILLHKVLIGNNISIKYQLPYSGITISCMVVFILLFILMKYSMKKINKKNVIETIRNENI